VSKKFTRVETFLEGRGKRPFAIHPSGYPYKVWDEKPRRPVCKVKGLRRNKTVTIITNVELNSENVADHLDPRFLSGSRPSRFFSTACHTTAKSIALAPGTEILARHASIFTSEPAKGSLIFLLKKNRSLLNGSSQIYMTLSLFWLSFSMITPPFDPVRKKSLNGLDKI